MATYSNTAREVEMPNGDVVVIHNAPTGGENTTSNIKKFKYDDNGHVTESSAADAEDLNLSGYSTPTTGTTAIGASDDVQTAIGKLDHQSQIDQTNILYSLNTGVKNLLTIKSTVTANGLTSVQQSDGYTVKITGTPTGGKSIRWSEVIKITESGTYKVKLTLSGTKATCYLYDISTSTLVHEYYSSNTYEETLTANHEYAMYTYSQSAIDATISAMLCTAAAYAQSPDYIAPALPNYDLTRLEAEDRASLAEVVDSGAKNIFEFGEFGVSGGSTVTISNNSVTATGAAQWAKAWRAFEVTKDTTYVLSFRVTNVATVTTPYYRVSVGSDVGGHSSYYGIINCNTTGSYHMKITVPSNTKIFLLVHPNYSSAASPDTPSITVDNIMICTQAAWNVSQKYVPYRPNWDLVAALAQNGGFIDSTLGSIITNADLNSIDKTTFAVYNEPANLPSGITGYCYVRTSVFDENSALQELYVIQPNPVSFFRIKLNNSWTVWVQTSNA